MRESDASGGRLRILWVATKCPEPPVDGGRRLLAESLAALAPTGTEITLVAPADGGADAAERLAPWCEPQLVATRITGPLRAGLRAAATGEPWALVRHRWPALAREVERLVAARRFDVVVAEQLQAAAAAAPARAAGVPLVLRAQNVESALWSGAAKLARGVAAVALAREARRLAAREGEALAGAAAVVALSAADGGALAKLARGGACIEVVPPPFPSDLPPGPERLGGEPALVLFGSPWEPNREGERFFLGEVWPRVRERLPGALLHRFGAPPEPAIPGSVVHPAPDESARAFAPDSILVLPLRLASGVRIRLLEAWARGIPVVATPEAASGLGVEEGREALLAARPEALANAIERLAADGDLRARLVASGRARLVAEHAPARFAERFLAVVRRVAGAA